MEKIDIESYEHRSGHGLTIELAEKLNEIVDWINKEERNRSVVHYHHKHTACITLIHRKQQ